LAGLTIGDNAQQGSSVEVALAWNLSEKDPVAPKPPTPAAPTAVPGPTPPQLVIRKLVTLRVPAQRVIRPRKLKAFVRCTVRCKLKFSAKIDNAPKAKKGRKARRARTLMARKVFKTKKGVKRWVTQKRANRQKMYTLKFGKKAMKRLKRQLARKHRVGITLTLRMRSKAGNRVVRRRLVVRQYKHQRRYRGRPAKLH
jgi:hypothetical protein